MKKNILEFIRKGMISCGFGPIVLVVLYLMLQSQEHLHTLSVNEVCIGILSLSALAFIAGGMNAIYQIEQIPLMLAVLIHGSVLYVSYLATYLINGWLELGITPILVFTFIFLAGYLLIWIFIYTMTKKKTAKLNEMLKQKHQIQKP